MKYVVTLSAVLLATACMISNAEVPQSAMEITPIQTKEHIPEVTLRTQDGTPVDLMTLVKKKPTVLIFYRGGWCPFCNRHLAQLQEVEDELIAMGYQILAISPDRPEKLNETAMREKLNYTLLSDSSMAAAQAFGIAFKVDAATVKQYKEEYKIDIEADSGETHHQLPVPAVFVIDTTGQIVFAHTNPDYKKRMNPDVLVGTVNLLGYRSKKF